MMFKNVCVKLRDKLKSNRNNEEKKTKDVTILQLVGVLLFRCVCVRSERK